MGVLWMAYCTVSVNVVSCDREPEVAVTVKVYDCALRLLFDPHPLNPTARAAPTRASTTRLFHRRAALRSLPEKGSRMRQNAIGSVPPANGRAGRSSAALPGNCTCRVTAVVPEPTVTVAGEKVAMEPTESPVTFSVMVPGRVGPPTGVTTSGKDANPEAVELTVPLPTGAMVKSTTVSDSTPLVAGP